MIKDVTQMRDGELRKRFSEIMDSGVNRSYYTWETAVHMLANQPAPRFYICPKKAQQYVYAMQRGKSMVRTPMHMQMVRDLAENFERIRANNPLLRMKEIWCEVVESPAKSFYITETTIKRIVYEYLRPKSNLRRI